MIREPEPDSIHRCRAVDATLAAHPGGCALQRKTAAIPIVGNGLRAVPAGGGGDLNPATGESAQGSVYRCRAVDAALRAINDRPYERAGGLL